MRGRAQQRDGLLELSAVKQRAAQHRPAAVPKKAREKHLKLVEKGLKEQYTPIMKKLTFSQGKLLIKLVNRQTDSSSYELVKAFMGPFKAGFYQTFAALFGASLKKEYHPEGEDRLTERVVLLVENGQI